MIESFSGKKCKFVESVSNMKNKLPQIKKMMQVIFFEGYLTRKDIH